MGPKTRPKSVKKSVKKYYFLDILFDRFSIALGQPSFRGRQLFDWIYRKKVDDFTQMTDLPKLFQEKLKGYSLHPLKILNTNSSSSKKTQKYLLTTKKGMTIESVLMRKKNRATICLSTQVGCAVDCSFCATAKMGFVKNLSVGEIIDQYFQLEKLSDTKITDLKATRKFCEEQIKKENK